MVTYLHDAIAACEQALDQQSEVALAFQRLGHVLQSMGRFEDALHWHSNGLQPDPNAVDAYTQLGRLYADQQHWQQAIAAYTKAIHLAPDITEAYWARGESLAQLHQPLAAIESWTTALTLAPHQATADAYCDLGNFFFKHEQLERAVMWYQKALQLNSRLSEAYHNLAEVLLGLGRWEEAIACYQEATRQDPEPAWAYHKLGDALLMQQQFDDALEAYQQAIHHNPTFPWSHHNQVDILLRQERWQEAMDAAHVALALEEDYAWAHTQLGRALIQMGDREGAIDCHRRACQLRSWPQCVDNNYQFTQDWFSHNIPSWQAALAPFAHQPQVRALEIGSFQGMSACWLLDHILTHPSAQLLCIDPAFQPEFDSNLAKTGASEKVAKRLGASEVELPTLPPSSYDIIYIDGCHLADYVYQDAMLSWRLLKVDGILIFDDYQWQDPNYPGHDPKLGIDQFLAQVHDQIDILHQHYQVILKKIHYIHVP